jgi:uncharacterized membrane protein YcaP (DUF421 family)
MEIDSLRHFWGHDEYELTLLQMCVRAFISFIAAIILLRISGRRTFGMKSPFDNTFVILIGAILAKGVVGSVDFTSCLAACFVLAVSHRLFAYFSLFSGKFGAWIKGDKILLYKDGRMYRKNMIRSLISENDFMERMRINGCDTLDDIKAAYMERNGEISIIRK